MECFFKKKCIFFKFIRTERTSSEEKTRFGSPFAAPSQHAGRRGSLDADDGGVEGARSGGGGDGGSDGDRNRCSKCVTHQDSGLYFGESEY